MIMKSRTKATNHKCFLYRNLSEIFMGISLENTSIKVLYLESCRLETNFAKKGLEHGYFPKNFTEFHRSYFSKHLRKAPLSLNERLCRKHIISFLPSLIT